MPCAGGPRAGSFAVGSSGAMWLLPARRDVETQDAAYTVGAARRRSEMYSRSSARRSCRLAHETRDHVFDLSRMLDAHDLALPEPRKSGRIRADRSARNGSPAGAWHAVRHASPVLACRTRGKSWFPRPSHELCDSTHGMKRVVVTKWATGVFFEDAARSRPTGQAGEPMEDPAMEKGRAYRMDTVHSEAEAQAILESSVTKDSSLEQVREILCSRKVGYSMTILL